jgi:hypothetical protein
MEGNNEMDRARRIAFTIDICHKSLADIYERLVDREFHKVDKDIISVISELRMLLKSIEHDDF